MEGHPYAGNSGHRIVQVRPGKGLDALGYLGPARIGDLDVVGQCRLQPLQWRDRVLGHDRSAAATLRARLLGVVADDGDAADASDVQGKQSIAVADKYRSAYGNVACDGGPVQFGR